MELAHDNLSPLHDARARYCLTCKACGRHEPFMVVIPTELWAQIARGDYALCMLCMDERLAEEGLTCEPYVVFYGRAGGLRTAAPPEWVGRAILAMQPEQPERVRASQARDRQAPNRASQERSVRQG